MKLTNKLNLPDGLVRAIQNDAYDKGDCDFSATELLKPPQQRALLKAHAHEITEDASDRIWSLLGQAAHAICERSNVSEIAEKRLYAKFGAHTVGAQLDSFEVSSGVLSDYKVTTMYKAKAGEPDPDFTAQLNIQAEILRENGYEVKQLRIIAILRDWSKLKAAREDDMPESNVVVLEIPMWPREVVRSFIEMRIALHLSAESSGAECSESERWAKPSIWAVMKGQRAIPGGLQYSKAAAESLSSRTAGTRVEFRPGENTRCAHYCQASNHCKQYQSLKGEE